MARIWLEILRGGVGTDLLARLTDPTESNSGARPTTREKKTHFEPLIVPRNLGRPIHPPQPSPSLFLCPRLSLFALLAFDSYPYRTSGPASRVMLPNRLSRSDAVVGTNGCVSQGTVVPQLWSVRHHRRLAQRQSGNAVSPPAPPAAEKSGPGTAVITRHRLSSR